MGMGLALVCNALLGGLFHRCDASIMYAGQITTIAA